MIILQSDIKAFGNLKNKEISLRPGMNVITGDNESGKTTFAYFLRSMLFGLDVDSEIYKRFFPQEFEGEFGGTIKALSDGAFYRIERNFVRGSQSLTITKLSDESIVEDPEEWLQQAKGGMNEADYAMTGFIPQGALIKEIDNWGLAPDKAEEFKQEAAIRAQYGRAAEKLQKEREGYMRNMDPELPEKMVDNAAELEEREQKKRELDDRFGKTDRELKEMEAALSKDDERVREENDAVVRNLKENIQKKKEELSKSVELTEKRHRSGAVFGTIFMAIGLLLGVLSWFYISSEKLGPIEGVFDFETTEELIAGIGISAAAFLFVLGVVLAIINAVNRDRVKKNLWQQDDLRKAAEASEREYQYYLDNRETLEAKIDHLAEREKRISYLQEKMKETSDEMKENDDRIKELLDNGQLYEKQSADQEKSKKEIEAIDAALASFERLSVLPEAEAISDAVSLRATDYFTRISGDRNSSIRVAPEGTLYLVTNNIETPVTELSVGKGQEVLLASRLALLEEKDSLKKLPVILDDVFSGFDESRMNATMNVLRSIGRQAVLLSCQTRERQRL